jgi:enterochelin esterase family protein
MIFFINTLRLLKQPIIYAEKHSYHKRYFLKTERMKPQFFIPVLLITFLIFYTGCLSDNRGNDESGKKEELMHGPPPFARVKSPEFNEDGTITFRIWAPKATEVRLQCSGILGDQTDLLEKFNEEYWRISLKPLKSGLFQYKFMVDGVQTADPVNPLSHGSSSLILVSGIETEFFTARNVPHGSIHRHFYHNPEIEAIRSVSIYTPPGYSDNPDRAYPVLFLLHGSGGTDESWMKEGKANIILDNLIADGMAEPMIVVAPFGHTVDPGTHGWPFVQEQGDFIQDCLEILLPFVKERYRLSMDSKEWAIAGFSMGGFHALKIGLNNLDQFGNIGPFSWGGDRSFFEKNAPQTLDHPEKVNEKLSTFYIACGKDDFLLKRTMKIDTILNDLGIEHTFYVSEGGHEMTNWRKYLHLYAQLLFQDH